MQKIAISALCLAMFVAASISHAATDRIVPTNYATIQAAVDAADAGDTITITNSATYAENVKITKQLNVVATAGQTPMIQSASGTTTPTLVFAAGSGGTKFGSLTGGQIRVNFVKPTALTAVVPNGMVKFEQSTGTLVTMENVLIDESGPSDGNGFPITNITHDSGINNTVTLKYVDIITSRTANSSSTPSASGIIIGMNKTFSGVSCTPTVSPDGGPTYNLDHVRIKYYTICGIMPMVTSTTLNVSYSDIGSLGDFGNRPASTNRPWGSLNQNGVTSATLIARIDHSIFNGSRASHNLSLSGAGSTMTLNRSVFLHDYYMNSLTGNIYLFGGSRPYMAGRKFYLTADHCDFVCKSTAFSTYPQIKTAVYATILRTTNSTTQANNIYPDVKISNSNIYSDYNFAVCFYQVHPEDSLVTDHCNVFTGGTKAYIGYTAGTGDLSMDPMYFDIGAADLRYNNNTLKTGDSEGKPIGVNASYNDPFTGIIDGEEGVVNRAHGWTTLK